MYEFVDVHGDRVTVRSVRTLGGLLQRGTIVASTPFRRAEDASFGPAAKHPELRAIAAQLGMALDNAAGTEARTPSPVLPQTASASATQPIAAAPVPTAAMPPVSRTSVPPTKPVAQPSHQAKPLPPIWEQPLPAATMLASGKSPWSRATPPGIRRQRSAETLAYSTAMVLLNLASAAVLGVVARIVMADVTGSHLFATGSMLAITILAARYAGRMVARRMPRPTGWAVSLAAALFGAGCYAMAGSVGVVIAVAATVSLWDRLSHSPRQ